MPWIYIYIQGYLHTICLIYYALTTLLPSTLFYASQHFYELHFTSLPFSTTLIFSLNSPILLFTPIHFSSLHFSTLLYTPYTLNSTLLYTSLTFVRFSLLLYTFLNSSTLLYTPLQFFTLLYTSLHPSYFFTLL